MPVGRGAGISLRHSLHRLDVPLANTKLDNDPISAMRSSFLPLGLLAGEVFPPCHRHVNVGRLDLDGVDDALASWRPRTSGFFGVSGMSSGSVLPAVAASGNTSSNEKMSRSFSPESASGRRSVSQDVSSDVRLSMTRNARAWRAGMVTTGAAVNPSEMGWDR